MTIVHAGTQTKKIYQNEKLTIQLNPKLKVKKIEKSNKSFRIKKCGVNKYTICSGRPGKGMVTVYTNKNNYRYSSSEEENNRKRNDGVSEQLC